LLLEGGAGNVLLESGAGNLLLEGTPFPPTALAAARTAYSQVTLSWTASLTPAVSGYNVYRGTSPGAEAPYDSVGAVTAYTDAAATPGAVLYYFVTATDAEESEPSNEASAPAGPPALTRADRLWAEPPR
jgi:hypothetical protein